MRMQFNVFGKKLFGAKYETMKRTLPVYLIVLWGAHGGRQNSDSAVYHVSDSRRLYGRLDVAGALIRGQCREPAKSFHAAV